MIKKGIIVEVNGREAVLFTQTGEFLKFKSNESLQIGQEYTYKNLDLKPFLIAASLLLCILLGSFITMYSQVYASMTVTINPQFRIDVNRFNRIIKVVPLNKDAEDVLSSVKLKNKNIDDGLILIVKKAKEKKYITDEYYNNKTKKINIEIDKGDVKLNKFTSEMKNQKLNFEKVYAKLQKIQDRANKRELIKEKLKEKDKQIENQNPKDEKNKIDNKEDLKENNKENKVREEIKNRIKENIKNKINQNDESVPKSKENLQKKIEDKKENATSKLEEKINTFKEKVKRQKGLN
jgi:hypothetical protein